MTDKRTFSESWYRVADLKIELRPAVTMRKQVFRDSHWYVLQDPFNNNFFRLRLAAYQFVSRLSKERSVEQVWQECLENQPETAPGQDEVIQLLAQLYQANLLYSELPADSSMLFDRYKKRQQRERKAKFSNLMFFRIPLFDPSPLLKRIEPIARAMTSRLAAFVWLMVVLLAAKTIIENFSLLLTEADSLLAFDNLILLYAGLVLVKIFHELGHTLVCRRFGGEVHTLGIMLIVFAPLPYMDATSSWAFRQRRQRVLVASSGMLFELFIAAWAALIWANTAPGALHSLAFNMLIAGSVSTLIFNLNPLLRFDGYYILSDLLEIPNLQNKASNHLKHLAKVWLLGCASISAVETNKEACWLTIFGLLSGAYRVIVYGGIIFFVADRFLILGLLMAVFCLITWAILPALHFLSYLVAAPQLNDCRQRAITVSAVIGSLLMAFLVLLPFPHQFRAAGIIEAESHKNIINPAPGRLTEIFIQNGTLIDAGTAVARLVDPELDYEITSVAAQRKEVLLLQQQNLTLAASSTSELLAQRLLTLDNKLKNLQQQRSELVITSPSRGLWVGPDLLELKGAWLPRGTELGQLISPAAFNFIAVITQEEAANLFDVVGNNEIEVRLNGRANQSLEVNTYRIIPYQQEQLPSAALGWAAGGQIPVLASDSKGLQTLEPFFRIDAALSNTDGEQIYHGHSGQIRFLLQPKPLLYQWLRLARQFFQKRYQT